MHIHCWGSQAHPNLPGSFLIFFFTENLYKEGNEVQSGCRSSYWFCQIWLFTEEDPSGWIVQSEEPSSIVAKENGFWSGLIPGSAGDIHVSLVELRADIRL